MTSPSANLRVRVQPRASRNQVVSFDGVTARLRVTAPPQDGKANEAVLALLAKTLGIAKSKISIVKGHAAREKVVLIETLTAEEVRQRLETGNQ